MREKDSDIRIICPKCGREYLPAEIYMPKCFFGDPGIIDRDDNGKIESITGKYMNTTEEFICEGCNCKFYIKAKMAFITKIDSVYSDSVVSIPRNPIKAKFMLNEE